MSDYQLLVMASIHAVYENHKLVEHARINAELLKGVLGG